MEYSEEYRRFWEEQFGPTYMQGILAKDIFSMFKEDEPIDGMKETFKKGVIALLQERNPEDYICDYPAIFLINLIEMYRPFYTFREPGEILALIDGGTKLDQDILTKRMQVTRQRLRSKGLLDEVDDASVKVDTIVSVGLENAIFVIANEIMFQRFDPSIPNFSAMLARLSFFNFESSNNPNSFRNVLIPSNHNRELSLDQILENARNSLQTLKPYFEEGSGCPFLKGIRSLKEFMIEPINLLTDVLINVIKNCELAKMASHTDPRGIELIVRLTEI